MGAVLLCACRRIRVHISTWPTIDLVLVVPSVYLLSLLELDKSPILQRSYMEVGTLCVTTELLVFTALFSLSGRLNEWTKHMAPRGADETHGPRGAERNANSGGINK